MREAAFRQKVSHGASGLQERTDGSLWLGSHICFGLYRLNPGSHHLTSLFFHAVNTLLLFLLLRRATGARWPGVFVAVVFAVHPLKVESVAWVWERQGVLGAFFLLICLWSYIPYTEKPGPSPYFMCLFLFALGLMAGPVRVAAGSWLVVIGISLKVLIFVRDHIPLV